MKEDIKQRIEQQRVGGKKLGNILQKLLEKAQIGVSLLEIEKEAQRLIADAGGSPSFQTVKGYQWVTCLCVDDDVVHGIPTEYKLQEGDVLTIDVGMLYGGYHTDTAWTKIITKNSQFMKNDDHMRELQQFLKVGKQALWESITQARAGNRVGHISQVIQRKIEGAGYSVVKALVGHSVGKSLHETPQIPGYLNSSIEKTPLLTEGMTLAIEVIYAQGSGDIVYANDDGWTLATRDG
ncbi:MAG: type I methionyl aminopeptidase, partial [Patescibacteria group bacterium]|nr:type I methionyl aminopeptidase [Patescibacteria group bacterium]